MVAAGVPLSSLRAVFLTHHHSDHTADFGTLFLLAWSQLVKPVKVFGPPPLSRMYRQFFAMHDFDIELRTEDEGRSVLRELVEAEEISDGGLIYQDDRVRVTCALVRHPPIEVAFAYRFDTADRAIVISGDTTPCKSLIELADRADVLVHEAMYVKDLAERVGEYHASHLLRHLVGSHTTAEDAGTVAAEADVGTLVLSHLFPADASVGEEMWLAAARAGFQGRVMVGRDLLEV